MRRKSKFYVFLRETRGELCDEAFERELMAAYKPRGQEPVPPALLATVMLLQAYTGLSDADAVDEVEMGQRWQLILGRLGQEQAPLARGACLDFIPAVSQRPAYLCARPARSPLSLSQEPGPDLPLFAPTVGDQAPAMGYGLWLSRSPHGGSRFHRH